MTTELHVDQPGLATTFCPHAFCTQRPMHVRFGKYRCRTLYQYWHTLLPHDPTKSSPEPSERCPAGRACLSWLSKRSLAWSILNLDETFKALDDAELILVRAYADNNFKLARSGLQADFNKARRRDGEALMKRLNNLAATAESNIVCTLQSNERGRPYQLKELTTAFTKRIRTPVPDSEEDMYTPDITPFLQKAVAALQRISGRAQDFEIPSWAVTSIDTDFDVDDNRLIGKGAFGRVVQGEWNGKVVAVKELGIPHTNSTAMDYIRHEVQIWSCVSHPNILAFFGACLESTKPFIVSEFCESGNALDYLRKNSHTNRMQLLYDVASGMAYLHDVGIIHADLKASNILIGKTGEALIADFGLSQIQDQVSSSIRVTRASRTSSERVVGTVRWMAPELLLGKGLNKPADIYSFALTAWEFYTNGAVPFRAIVNMEQFCTVVTMGQRPKRPYQLDHDKLWALVERCWHGEPQHRPDFIEVQRLLARFLGRGDKGKSEDRRRPSFAADSLPRSRRPLTPLDVKSLHMQGGSPISPPRRHFSLRTARRESDGKASYREQLDNNDFGEFTTSTNSKDTQETFVSPGSIPNSHHLEKTLPPPPPSDKPPFTIHAEKLLALSESDTSEDSPSIPASPIEDTLAFFYDYSLKQDGVSEILGEEGLVPATVKRLLHPDCHEKESYLLLGLLTNLACHGNGRSVIMAQPDIMQTLSFYVSPSQSIPVQENATRCLYNLSTEVDSSHYILAEADSVVPSLGLLLSTTFSMTIAKNVLGCLTNLSLKDPGRSVILSTTVTIDGLIHSLRPDTDEITREQALLCIGNLSVDIEKGVSALLAHSELIPSLSSCFTQESATPAIKGQALRCLRNIAKSVSSHILILDHPEILSAACDVLAQHGSSNQQKYALHFLHRFTSSYLGKDWLRDERTVWPSLRWYVDHGSSEDQARAISCLKLVEDLL